MIIDIIKFIHVLFALGLLGLTFYAVAYAGSSKSAKLTSLNKNLLIISLLAILTGTLLVYPKHYTFHTLWIQAAYLLLVIYGLTLRLITLFCKKFTHPWLWRSVYILLTCVLIIVVHDAVSKNTMLTKDLLAIASN